MSENNEPPPLFDNVDIFDKDDDNDDLFTSAVDDFGQENSQPAKPMLTELPKLQLNFDKDQQTAPTPVEEFDSDEIKLQSPEPATKKLLQITSAEHAEKEGGDQFLEIRVSDTNRVGDGMASYIAYKIEMHTNIPLFKKKTSCVQRRFSDFLGLHDKLVEKYLRTGRIIPPAPEKNVVGTAKLRMAQNEQGSSSEFIEQRRSALERYLVRTAAHPTFKGDPDFREFLEADVVLPKATNTSALSGAGVMRLFNKVGETVNKITYKMDENDPWFEEKIQHLESLDGQLRKLLVSVETLVIARRDLAMLTSAFAKSAAILSNCEEHTSLSRALSQLAEVEEKVESLHNEQANTDFSILCELLKDYVAMVGAIRDVFHERVKVYQNWQHSQLMLNKKREQKAKMDLANKTDKGTITNEIIEWEAKVERCQEEFTGISKMIKKEMERFEIERVKNFKSFIYKYLEEQMSHQHQDPPDLVVFSHQPPGGGETPMKDLQLYSDDCQEQ